MAVKKNAIISIIDVIAILLFDHTCTPRWYMAAHTGLNRQNAFVFI
jgi:hypothetical protein